MICALSTRHGRMARSELRDALRPFPTSWPGLSRPSTSSFVCGQGVDTRDKPAHDGVWFERARHVISNSTVKQPLLFRHASSPPLFAARGRRRRLHSRPLVRGRAERRVPVAPLGLMRMRSSAIVSASGLSEAPSDCPTFRIRCFFGCLRVAMANDPITKITVPRRMGQGASSE